jgi:hypothetical protein
MWFRKIFLVLIVSFSICDYTSAQQATAKTDSTHLYENIETYSKRSKFGKFMYRLVFKPVTTGVKKGVPKTRDKGTLIQKPYNAFDGKIIRNIDIVTLDPFGYSVNDTITGGHFFLPRAGNWLHIKTQSLAIRNLLLTGKNKPFNSLYVKESERLIRRQKYVHDVSFFVVPAGEKSDSADIFIKVLDRWSIIPEGAISGSGFRIDITDKNFLGFGHEFQNSFKRNFSNGINAYNTNYTIPNIRNTYINTTLHFGADGYKNYSKGLAIDRPFFSPLTKWAAGFSVSSQFRKDSVRGIDMVYMPVSIKFKTQDYWAGYSYRIFKGNTEDEKVTNLIIAGRYKRLRYADNLSILSDPFQIYSDEDFYLAAVGISARKYIQDKYVFKFGVIEDVPVGKVYELTGGYQIRNNSGRFYLGTRISFGNYYNWGYLSSSFEYGTFFRASHAEQGVITAGVNYYTQLFEIGRWKFRQFVKPQVTLGLHRLSYDTLTLNDGYGLDGFISSSISGVKRMMLTVQTQSYAPWNVLGFRFGPFLTCSLGMLGEDGSGFKNSRVYSQLGIGVLIKNENLVLNTFQISISFYPVIPGKGLNIFKANSFRTTDFGYRDFEIGRPSQVLFQ